MIHRFRGFTLLELLLATALAAMLMALLMGIAGSTRRSQRLLESPQSSPHVMGQFEQLLNLDLAQCSEMVHADNGDLILVGQSRLDRSSQDQRHGPTRIVYRLRDIGGRGYLLRQQSELDNRTNQESQIELILCGVKQFDVEIPTAAGIQPANGPKPSSAWLSLAWEDSNVPPIRKLLVLD